MTALWVISLILAIPTFGISILIMVALHFYINNTKTKNIEVAIHLKIPADSLPLDLQKNQNSQQLAQKSIQKYRIILKNENLTTTKTDIEIAQQTSQFMDNIKQTLILNNQVIEDVDLLQNLAIRFLLFSELVSENKAEELRNIELKEVKIFGISYVINKKFPSRLDLFLN